MHRLKVNLVRCSLFVTLLVLVVTLVGLCCLAVETLYMISVTLTVPQSNGI